MGWSYGKVEFTPEMKQMGFEELSPDKRENDNEYVLRQLAQRMPLAFWCELLDCNEERAAILLARKRPFGKFFELSVPICNYSDRQWAYYTIKESASYQSVTDMVGLLTAAQREEIKWIDKQIGFDTVPRSWFDANYEAWGPRFSRAVLSWLLHNRWLSFASDTAERLALYIDPQLRPDIFSLAPKTPQGVLPSVSEFCMKLEECMDLKEEIDKIFKDNANERNASWLAHP